MVATVVVLLVHLPLPVASVNVEDAAEQAMAVPDIAAGNGLTVNVFVTLQPAKGVNVIVAVPAAIPVVIPVAEPMVATEVLLLAQVPVLASDKVLLDPTHADAVPAIADAVLDTAASWVCVVPAG